MEPDLEAQEQHDIEIRFRDAVRTGEFNGVALEGEMLGFATSEREELKGWFKLFAADMGSDEVQLLFSKMLPGLLAAENYFPTLDEVMGNDNCTIIVQSLIDTFTNPQLVVENRLVSLRILASLCHCSIDSVHNIAMDPGFDFSPVVKYCEAYLLGSYNLENEFEEENGPPQLRLCLLLLLLLFDNYDINDESAVQIAADRYMSCNNGALLSIMLSLKMYFKMGALPDRLESSRNVLTTNLINVITKTDVGNKASLVYLSILCKYDDVCQHIAESLLLIMNTCESTSNSLMLAAIVHNVCLSGAVSSFCDALVRKVIEWVAQLLRRQAICEKASVSLGLVAIHSLLLSESTADISMSCVCQHATVFKSRQKQCQGTQFVVTSSFDEFGEPIGEQSSEEDTLDNEIHHQLSPIIYIIEELAKKNPPTPYDFYSGVTTRLLHWTRSVISGSQTSPIKLIGMLPALPELKPFKPSIISHGLLQFEILKAASTMLYPDQDSELYFNVISCCWGEQPDWTDLRITTG